MSLFTLALVIFIAGIVLSNLGMAVAFVWSRGSDAQSLDFFRHLLPFVGAEVLFVVLLTALFVTN